MIQRIHLINFYLDEIFSVSTDLAGLDLTDLVMVSTELVLVSTESVSISTDLDSMASLKWVHTILFYFLYDRNIMTSILSAWKPETKRMEVCNFTANLTANPYFGKKMMTDFFPNAAPNNNHLSTCSNIFMKS